MNNAEYVEHLVEFYGEYYAEEIEAFATEYPATHSLWVDVSDVAEYDETILDDYTENPPATNNNFERALGDYLDDNGHDINTEAAHVRLTDEEGRLDKREVSDLSASDTGRYVAVTGQLSKVTEKRDLLDEAVWECRDCGTPNRVPQPRHRVLKPGVCRGCEGSTSFGINWQRSHLVDQRKLKLETPPDVAAQGEGASIDVYVTDDLCDYGGDNGIPDRAGEKCTILAERKIHEDDLHSRNATPEFDSWLDAHAIVFHGTDNEDVNIEENMEAITECLNHDDPVTLFKENIVPSLEADDDFDIVLEACVAWLFGGYRIDMDSATYRGDIHMALIGDPGTGKSTLLSELHRIAPVSEFRSGTGLTKAGLTAAAVHEEFGGESKWVLEPGILPRANGGHCIIDEVDDVLDGDTKAIHDALEAQQMVKVDKAGLTADLETRTSLLASGNPEHGRFDRYEPVAEQIDLDPALIDRMDVLLDIQDVVDEDTDRKKAGHYLDSYDEVSRLMMYERGELEVKPDMNAADREVPVEVLRAWVAHCRDTVRPLLTPEAKRELKSFYIDVRNLNNGYDDHSNAEAIPATLRKLGAGLRMSTGYARCEGSKKVEPRHVERAKVVTKAMVGLNYDPSTGQFDAGKTDSGGNLERWQRIRRIVSEMVDDNDGEAVSDVKAIGVIAAEMGIGEDKAEHEVGKLKIKGELYEPEEGHLRPT